MISNLSRELRVVQRQASKELDFEIHLVPMVNLGEVDCAFEAVEIAVELALADIERGGRSDTVNPASTAARRMSGLLYLIEVIFSNLAKDRTSVSNPMFA